LEDGFRHDEIQRRAGLERQRQRTEHNMSHAKLWRADTDPGTVAQFVDFVGGVHHVEPSAVIGVVKLDGRMAV
jgi:hypothetical protein